MKARVLLASLAIATMAASGSASAQEAKVFREGQFDEKAVISALAPPLETTRDIVVGAPARPRPKPGQPGSASMPLLITFETNSAELTDSARQNLDVVGRALASENLARFRFTIEGHADPRGTREMNQTLSQQRAESVVSYLADAHHIARERLEPTGRGDLEPLKPDLPSAPENRRVMIKTITRAP